MNLGTSPFKKEKLSPQMLLLLEQCGHLEKYPLAKLISIFENTLPQNRSTRHHLIRYLEDNHKVFHRLGYVVGMTGTPGAGKSSLIGEICLTLLSRYPDFSMAILAVDPSSHDSGGSILGDRTRVYFPRREKRIFFRSQASDLELGGLSQKTYQVTRILQYFFDLIFIETVGIGQNEIEIQQVSDHTNLILQPFTGDQIQFMKAGIMEIPDTFIINKCDEDALARKSYHLLRSSLKLSRITISEEGNSAPIFLTSATKKRGIQELTTFIHDLPKKFPAKKTRKEKEDFYLKKWIELEYGKYGLRFFQQDLENLKNQNLTFEEKEQVFMEKIKKVVAHQ